MLFFTPFFPNCFQRVKKKAEREDAGCAHHPKKNNSKKKNKKTTNQQSEGKTAKRLRVPLTVQQQREQRQQQRCPHGALCGRPRFGSLRSPRRAPAALPRPRTRCPLRSRGRCAASPARPRLRPLGTGAGVGGGVMDVS